MSVNATIITCSKCSFLSSDGVTNGRFKYKTNDGLINLKRKLAWCNACQTLVPGEVIPNDCEVNKLKEELLQLNQDIEKEKSRLKEQQSIIAKIFFKPDSFMLSELSVTKDMLQDSINEMEKLKQYVDTNRKARCLECGSHEISYLPSLSYEEVPIPIGMKHPGCGGEFLAAVSPIRFSIGYKERVYTNDGIEIPNPIENKPTSCDTIKSGQIEKISHSNTESSNINIAIEKQILIWHQACLMGVDMDLLKKPRPMLGAILFFIGSIDNLCQANNIDDKNFAKLAIELLDKMGFQKDFTVPILKNFYTQQKESKFALKANIEGGKKLNEFLSGTNEFAPLAFEALVREWAENPNIGQDELFLFQEASETLNPVKNKPTLEAPRAKRERLEKEKAFERLIAEGKKDNKALYRIDKDRLEKKYPIKANIIICDGGNCIESWPEYWNERFKENYALTFRFNYIAEEIWKIAENSEIDVLIVIVGNIICHHRYTRYYSRDQILENNLEFLAKLKGTFGMSVIGLASLTCLSLGGEAFTDKVKSISDFFFTIPVRIGILTDALETCLSKPS